jgi:hypothetical protein
VFRQVRAVSDLLRRLPVKPSAKPTLVRTQHLPPRKTQGQAPSEMTQAIRLLWKLPPQISLPPGV